MVKTVKEDRFDDIKESKAAVADFSATWCGPCKMMAPVFHAVADEMGDEVDFYSVDVYEMLGIPRELYTPLFAVARIVGWSAHRIEELVTTDKIIRPAYKSLVTYRDYVDRADR